MLNNNIYDLINARLFGWKYFEKFFSISQIIIMNTVILK